jgi:coenzyme F420 biosynthesis associated uncharacterized protein
MAPGDNGRMGFASERLIDWGAADRVGRTVAGLGQTLSPVERARLVEDFSELVPEAEAMVQEFTGLQPGSQRSRAWVMTRGQWLHQNLRGFERVLEPFAKKLVGNRPDGALAGVRRSILGAQLGALLGYLGHRVLGQYDMFLPPDDDGLLYFVGANVAGVESKHGFTPRDFRLWICLHEVTHRLQFGGAPWLRGYLTGLMDSYLNSVELDPSWLMERLRAALDEVRTGRVERGFGWVFILMSPDQRDMVKKMQAAMSLLEGHSNYAMDEVGRDRIPDSETFRETLHERRNRAGLERAFQRAIGFDVKVRQYALGERFVSKVIEQVGIERFNRVWEDPSSLPTMDEIRHPAGWVARVAAS